MRKRITMIMALALLGVTGVYAQSAYDAANIAREDLNGTARFVGMGGAMSALGGDITTMGTNPAGIGIYRSNDAMVSFGYSLTGTEADFAGNTFEREKGRWSLDNIGFVLANKFSNISPLRYVNFGFNYKKSKSFYRNMTMQGLLGRAGNGQYISQVNLMAQQATFAAENVYYNYNEYINFESPNIFYDEEVGWLGALGYLGGLTEEDLTSADYNIYHPLVPSEVDGYFRSQERGGIDEYDFNVAFNISDRFYLGATVGIHDVDYNKYTLWDEIVLNGDNESVEYALESYNWIKGTGFDMKFGLIFRPIETSPLRIGLSLHTPVFYKLTYTTGALLKSDGLEVNTQKYLDGGDMERDFRLQTPWVFNASLGYTLGNYFALGAEYEFENYSAMKFKDVDGYEMGFETEEVKHTLRGVNTFRLGAEFKPVPAFAFRVGYNFSSAAYKSDAFKDIAVNSINTDTEYSNDKSRNTFTLGIGYRGTVVYADLAYKYDTYKSDFYPFYDADLMATQVTNTRSQVLFTLGFRY